MKKAAPAAPALSPYDKMSIGELETAVRGSLATHKSSLIDAITVLGYLQSSKRYKENQRYAKEPFKVYLEDMYSIRWGTYVDWRKASYFPDAAREFGVGLIAKVVTRCGAVRAANVFKEIMELEEVRAKRIPRDKINDIIMAYTDPRRMVKREINDWRAMYEREAMAHNVTKVRLRDLVAENKELREQISKLKGKVKSLAEINPGLLKSHKPYSPKKACHLGA